MAPRTMNLNMIPPDAVLFFIDGEILPQRAAAVNWYGSIHAWNCPCLEGWGIQAVARFAPSGRGRDEQPATGMDPATGSQPAGRGPGGERRNRAGGHGQRGCLARHGAAATSVALLRRRRA